MANLGSATLMVNVACEMVYIVLQKLREGYSQDEGARCLCGLLGALSHPSFVETLFSLKQNSTSAANSVNESDDILNDRQALQDVLQQLCVCSCLALDEASMSLMLDNLLMMFKYQVMSASSLNEITMNHLQEMFKIAELAGNQTVLASLVDLKARFETAFGQLGIGDSADLRMRILAFLQDKRYEARMMLEDGKMAPDFGINYSMNCLEGLPARSEKPGAIRFFDNKGANWRSKSFDPLAVTPGSLPPDKDFFDSAPSEPPLGCDMFAAYEPISSEMMSPTTPHAAQEEEMRFAMQNMTPEQRAAAEIVETLSQGSNMAAPEGGDNLPSAGLGDAAEEGDEFDLILARNSAVAAALKSLDNVMSNLPTAKLPGPKYDPHNPDAENPMRQSGSSPSSSRKKSMAEDDLLGKLDQLAAVTEQPSAESLMSALTDLSALDTNGGAGGQDAETEEAMSLLNSVASKPTKDELNAALSDLSGLMPTSSEMDEALASLDSIAAASSHKAPTADELSAALLAVEAHPNEADVDALNMLDSVAQTKLDKDGQQPLDAAALSSALAGLDGLGDAGGSGAGDGDIKDIDLSGLDLGNEASLSALTDALATLDGDVEGLPTVDDNLSLPKSPTFELRGELLANNSASKNTSTDDSKSPNMPQSFVFDLSGLDPEFSTPEGESDEGSARPIANSAVFDLSGLGDF